MHGSIKLQYVMIQPVSCIYMPSEFEVEYAAYVVWDCVNRLQETLAKSVLRLQKIGQLVKTLR